MSGDPPALPPHQPFVAPPEGYGVMLAIRLPRDALSVPVIRRLVRDALKEVGVEAGISEDIELALTEACTNVLDHSGPGDAYDVTVTIGPEQCELRIIDIGHGFDYATFSGPSQPDVELTAEQGRGIGLMHALVDHIEFKSEPEAGTLVRLVKQLTFDPNTPAQRLLFQALHGSGEPPPASPGDVSDN
ncbi:MAG TPA: ATP-binding protein [Mycobacteriales bacterium]|nr:ATP-binding protein [Mycobacteriales bacterium]